MVLTSPTAAFLHLPSCIKWPKSFINRNDIFCFPFWRWNRNTEGRRELTRFMMNTVSWAFYQPAYPKLTQQSQQEVLLAWTSNTNLYLRHICSQQNPSINQTCSTHTWSSLIPYVSWIWLTRSIKIPHRVLIHYKKIPTGDTDSFPEALIPINKW